MIAQKERIEHHYAANRWRVDLNPIAVAIMVGAVTGLLVLGIGARAAMRLVALIAGMQPSFTLGGSTLLLVAGTIIGAILALLYLPVKRWLPFYWPVKGILFGLLFATITIVPFMGELEGEAALVAPWIGAGLFAILPLAFSLALATALNWQDQRAALLAPRNVGLLWLILYISVLILAFTGMAAIVDGARVPSLLRRTLEGGGVPFHQVRQTQGVLMMLVVLLFFGLHSLAFWRGTERTPIQLLSFVQLSLAALFVRLDPIWPTLIDRSAGGMGEWLAWGLLSFGFLLAIVALLRQRLRHPDARCRWNWIMAGCVLFFCGFLLTWLAVLRIPDLQLRNWTAVQTTFTVAPLLLPWLSLPAALVGATLCGTGPRALPQ